jgi:predicted NUDIX family NTP pyrophosphohydrolase
MVTSAGLLIYRRRGEEIEVLLTHPGGPFWSKKDVWSIPKGEVEEGESLEAAMEREFSEETGLDIPVGERLDLGEIKQGSAKINHVWAVEGDPDISKFVCRSTFSLEWPLKSGKQAEFPETDRACWFNLSVAGSKIFKNQAEFISRLADKLQFSIKPQPKQQALL